MSSNTPFALEIQPNDQRRPPRPPKYIREKKDTPEQRAYANFYTRCTEPAHPAETKFRHSHWQGKRAKVRKYLISVGINTFALDAFDECGSACQVQWSDTANKYRLAANYCHSRHCEPCMRAKANRQAANLEKRLKQEPEGRYRFITLTLRHSATPLVDQLKRLNTCFKALRKTAMWKTSQRGGAYTVEVKYEHVKAMWHPHLHIISEGGYLDQADLSKTWLAITGDSKIVDIRALKSAHDAAHYVSKYVTKGTSNNVWDRVDAAQEWITATKGLRTCATFGTWRGYKLLAIDKSITDWTPVCSLRGLMERVAAREEHAMRLFLILRPPGDHDAPARATPPLDPGEGIYTSS